MIDHIKKFHKGTEDYKYDVKDAHFKVKSSRNVVVSIIYNALKKMFRKFVLVSIITGRPCDILLSTKDWSCSFYGKWRAAAEVQLHLLPF